MTIAENKYRESIKYGFWHMPKTFYPVIFIEFWERFAFYGLQSVAVLFFIRKFGLQEGYADNLFASFSALLYALLVIGGYLGDKVLGLRRTYLLGIIFLMIGYSSFSFINNISALYWSMGMVLVGNVFFKTNAGNYVNRCFPTNYLLLDSAFTYFYMSINLGSFCGIVAIPFISAKTSYSLGIGFCGLGMLIALISYFKLRKNFIDGDNDIGKNVGNKLFLMLIIAAFGVILAYVLGLLLYHPLLSKIMLFCIAVAVFIIYFIVRAHTKIYEQKAMMIGFILLIEAIFFNILYMQMATSLTLFAVHNVRTTILGMAIPPEVTQSFDAFYIFLLSPILATIYYKSEQSGKPLTIPGKFAFGMFSCSLAYILLSLSCFLHDDNGTISLIWLFLGYGLYALGEVLIGAIGLSMVSKLVPKRLGGFAQAIWFVTVAIGLQLGGIISSFGAVDNTGTTSNLEILHGYQILFGIIGVATLAFSLILLSFVKNLARGMVAALSECAKAS